MSARKRIGKPLNNAVSAVTFEGLESRQLFNAIAWTGAGDGVNWSNGANWSGGVSPGFADDVTINVAANPNIQITGSRVVKSLVNAESLTINGSGSSLTCNGVVSSSGVITMKDALLAGGSWNFSGAGHIEIAGNSHNQIGLGAMINGDINLAAANGRVSMVSNSTFYNIHLAADATSVAFPANATIAGNIFFEGAGTGGRYVEGFNQAGSLLISSGASIRAAAGFGGTGYIGTAQWFGNSIATLNNGGTIASDFGGRPINITTTSFHNTVGTINAKDGGTVNIASPNWTNDDLGTINVNGGTLTTAGTWSNAGTINLPSGTINFGGTFGASTFDWASFHRTGGTVNLTGTLNNNIPSLTLDANTGTWNLAGGTINGGALNFAGGATLTPTDQGGALQDVNVGGDIVASVNGAHLKILGTTTFQSLHLSADNAGVGFSPNYHMKSRIVFDGAGTGARFVEAIGTGSLTIDPGAVVDTDASFGGSAHLGAGNWYVGQTTLINNGLISNDCNGHTMMINGSGMTSAGAIVAANGAVMSVIAGQWQNISSGTISATDSTLNFGGNWSSQGGVHITNSTLNLGGSFSMLGFNVSPTAFVRTGGTVNITGTVNNTSLSVWQNDTTGNWNLAGGTIVGGHLSCSNGHELDFTSTGGTLKDLTAPGDLNLDTNHARVTIAGSTAFNAMHLAGDNSAVAFANGYTLNAPVYLEGSGTGGRSIEASGISTVTIGANGSIRTMPGYSGTTYIGQSGGTMTMVNNGLIRSDVAGRSIYIGAPSFTNNGQIQLAGATMIMQPSNWTNALGATIGANASTVTFSNNWNNRGTLGVFSNSTLNLGGNWRTAEFNFAGFTNSASTVNVTGNLDNGDSVIHLNGATGSWFLKNGTISGGQIDFANGAKFELTDWAGKLQGVVVHGDLWANMSFARALIDVDTTFDTLHLVGDGSSVQLEAGYVLNGAIEFGGAGAGSRNVQLYTPGALTVSPTGSIKTVAGFGGTAYIGQDGQAMMLIDNGLIESNVSGKQMSVVPQTGLTVNGTMRSTNGGVLRVSNTNAMNVTAGANVVANSIRTSALTVDGATTIAPGGTNADCSIVGTLAVNGTGYLDLNDNDLLLNYTGASPRAAVQAMMTAGRNAGSWNGAGIRSTSAKNSAQHNTTLGLLEAAEYTPINGSVFDGQVIDNTALLLKYTWYGDADFNGVVNFDDYSRIDNGFTGHKTGWLNGDFDGNGTVNFDDYSLIDAAFNTQAGAL